MLAACGGGSASDAFDTASTVAAASRNTTAFAVTSPAVNTTVSGTVTVKGTTGSKWTKVSVVDMTTGNKVARDATPANGSFSTTVDTTRQVNAKHTWQITATDSTGSTRSVQNVNVVVNNTKATARIFYGANGHNNEGGAYDISSPALQLSKLQDLGAKIYRNEVIPQRGVQRVGREQARGHREDDGDGRRDRVPGDADGHRLRQRKRRLQRGLPARRVDGDRVQVPVTTKCRTNSNRQRLPATSTA
ncbi:hypothetical protein BPUN_2327 [Candidatus Paraburkholderia kirkii]|nr:hypothetical protein BPUN_2327 [Candidatus Paraburkholderia kirkii]